MRPKTNRLLMLLVGAVISGCASQTERSSSGAGAQTQTEYERVGGSSNAVTQEELARREAAKAAAAAPPPPPARAPEPPPAKPAPAAAAPKDEATPDFPVTKYELQEDEEVEDLGTLEDESVSADQEAAAAGESSVGETTEYADSDEEDVEDLGPQDDESASALQEAAPAGESSVGETTAYADSDQEEEIGDLGTQPDESGTMKFPEEKRAAADNLVGEPKIYPDEPAPKPAPAAPKSVSINFETEPLFSFDRFEIRGDQRAKLDELISGLAGAQYDSISVVGHADRIGSDAYNQKLSEKRASAVKTYLMKKGVPSAKIQVEARGESQPVTGDGCDKSHGKALIACLQPDRRVDVSVSATKISN